MKAGTTMFATIAEAMAFAVQQHRSGNLPQAERIYRQVLQSDPGHAHALHYLGLIAYQVGRYDDAVQCIREAIRLDAGQVDFHCNLAAACLASQRTAEAIACSQRAIDLDPRCIEGYNNLALAWQRQGNLDQAAACAQRAILLKPDCAEAHNSLGTTRLSQGALADAAACFERAIALQPGHAEAHNNLGYVRLLEGNLEEAVAGFRRAVAIRPDYANALSNLGGALREQGNLDESVACLRWLLERKPDFSGAHSNLLYTLHFCPGYRAQDIYDEHRQWNQRHARPLAGMIRPHANGRSPDRRLRIGYVSPDFRAHPVGRFLLPLLESHDHERFEIFCYDSAYVPDAITERCRTHADVWRRVLGLPDEPLAEAIRQDRIDILVDLTMHMANNRMLVFARKPAPVQVTYLAYCGTTGLETIDYRLTDPYLDPPGEDDRCYSERSVRLPETYWCYQPVAESPPVGPLPALEAGHVTFGCLNNFCKVTAPTLEAWARLLEAVPRSRLVIHALAGSHRDRVRDEFVGRGIPSERLEFAGRLPVADYFRTYGRIDVALDPFPYGGGTTTCDALWMGVPVVSMRGETAVGRAGLSILSNTGLADLVARDVDEYVNIAAALSNDLARLQSLRATLRDRLRSSPLMDAPRFARNVEAAYRWMWRQWCEKQE